MTTVSPPTTCIPLQSPQSISSPFSALRLYPSQPHQLGPLASPFSARTTLAPSQVTTSPFSTQGSLVSINSPPTVTGPTSFLPPSRAHPSTSQIAQNYPLPHPSYFQSPTQLPGLTQYKDFSQSSPANSKRSYGEIVLISEADPSLPHFSHSRRGYNPSVHSQDFAPAVQQDLINPLVSLTNSIHPTQPVNSIQNNISALAQQPVMMPRAP